MKVEMANGDVYQVEDTTSLGVDAAGNLVLYDYRKEPRAHVAAFEWRIAGEWLKVQRIEINAAKGGDNG